MSRHRKDLESGGGSSGGFHEDDGSDISPFDIVRTKSPAVDRLRKWRQAALVQNASRHFRYTLDLKEEEKKQVLAKIRQRAQVIRDAYLFNKTYKDIKIKLQKILSATNNFADENLVMEDGFGKYYKGQLLQSGQLVDIVARRLDCKYENGDVEFLTEVSMLYGFEHKYIVSIIGFCDEKDEKIIVYEHALHGCLNQHLYDPTLTWFQRLQICLGVARALSYIHYDVIHCGIDSSKIFLDKDWEPKVFGFEFSTKYPQIWKHRLRLSRYFDTRSMTPKDDVYSFGVLLFEVLSGRKSTICVGGVYEKLDEIIHPKLREQMVTQSVTIFTKTAYNCLNQQRVERPTMDQIVKELEEALELQWIHDNIEHSVAAAGDEDTSANLLKGVTHGPVFQH